MNLKEFLKNNLEYEAKTLFGYGDKKVIGETVEAWINDKENSKWRFDELDKYISKGSRILDLSTGVGTALYYGLLNGYDIYGIEPENWKIRLLLLKIENLGYPSAWKSRIAKAVGENLPYADNSFDCVTSYQTLEHVDDMDAIISEMIRVTKKGGILRLICPDYVSAFEPHYHLPWLPLFPRFLAKYYLTLLGRPTAGLNTINYTTKGILSSKIRKISKRHHGLKIEIMDMNKENFKNGITNKKIHKFYRFFRIYDYFKSLFKYEMTVNLLVRIEDK